MLPLPTTWLILLFTWCCCLITIRNSFFCCCRLLFFFFYFCCCCCWCFFWYILHIVSVHRHTSHTTHIYNARISSGHGKQSRSFNEKRREDSDDLDFIDVNWTHDLNIYIYTIFFWYTAVADRNERLVQLDCSTHTHIHTRMRVSARARQCDIYLLRLDHDSWVSQQYSSECIIYIWSEWAWHFSFGLSLSLSLENRSTPLTHTQNTPEAIVDMPLGFCSSSSSQDFLCDIHQNSTITFYLRSLNAIFSSWIDAFWG